MIDHIGFAVSNMERSKTFYVDALKPLGVGVVMEVTAEETGADAHAGFGKDNKAFFWIGGAESPRAGTHSPCGSTRADVIRSTARLWPPAAVTMGRRDKASLPSGLLRSLRPRS